MKNIIFLLLTGVIISCSTNKEQEISKENVIEETHIANEIHLTKAQIEAIALNTVPIEQMKIRNKITVTGTIEVPPQSKATIYAPMEAFVHKTDLLPGDKVVKGQVVAVLKHPNFVQLQYSFVKAVNENTVAKLNFERKKVLLSQDIASKKSVERAEGTFNSTQSLLASLKAQLKMVGLDSRLIMTKGIQEYIYIKSPMDGFVVESSLNQGKFLATNSEMMEIIDTDHMHAELNVFGTDITKIKKGDAFTFQPSGVALNYQGYIKLISQKVDDTSKTVNVHGHFEDHQKILKSGMFINAQIWVGGKKGYAVPSEAVVEIEGEQFVFVAESDVEFVPVEITVGTTDNGFTEIKSIIGNNFKRNVVSKGAHFLKGKLLQMAGGMEGHGH